ncbi:protein SIEVE ELEMENT OCCLUSION B-like [Quillaja saponaria]|uniref:Protein SIEVE ELEMENT OCCLUSION B-like n=1 Tax=Quillaja saponaria TaxID=32244 RepID=A0AAD7KWK7_QUISA|nr:protein SIEVE ELEMENT OCCLUSION B-like [Quillaja saponaria]
MIPQQWASPCGNQCTNKYVSLTQIPWRVFCKKGCNFDGDTWEECLEECNQICYKDPVLKDQQWSAYIDRSPGADSYSEQKWLLLLPVWLHYNLPRSSNIVKASAPPLQTLPDHAVLDEICATNVYSIKKIDVESLYIVVRNILKHATHIVDTVVQNIPINDMNIHVEDLVPPPNFDSPLSTLREISCEMTCNHPIVGESKTKRTLAILNKLSTYSWVAKAVLTLGAFALDYHPALVELNNIIKTLLQVVESFIEFDKLSASYDKNDVPDLIFVSENLPHDVYVAIISAVASSEQVINVTGNVGPLLDLSIFGENLNIIHNRLKKHLSSIKQQIEEEVAYKALFRFIQTPNEIMEIIKVLISAKDDQKPLFDGSANQLVDAIVTKGKNVLVLISGLNISEKEIEHLKRIFKGLKEKVEHYKIVWFPMVSQWDVASLEQFNNLKSKMPWYTVQNFSYKPGQRYITKEWLFKNQPIIVVLSPLGRVLHQNAMHMIQVWRIEAFPFTVAREKELNSGEQWIGDVVTTIDQRLNGWIKEDKYIFFYGGKDKDCIQKLKESIDTFIKETKVSMDTSFAQYTIELFQLGENDPNILADFWTNIESLFVTKARDLTDKNTKEVLKLFSLKNESAWVFLVKGSRLVLTAVGNTILQTLEKFDEWKQNVPSKGFEGALLEYFKKVCSQAETCIHLYIQGAPESIPGVLTCPNCARVMEISTRYNCCHGHGGRVGI